MNLVSLSELCGSRSSFCTGVMLSQQDSDRFLLQETSNEEIDEYLLTSSSLPCLTLQLWQFACLCYVVCVCFQPSV